MARRRFRSEPSVEKGEINLVPYLDVMVNLIMFLLLTLQVLPDLKEIDFAPPGVGKGAPQPQITVLITQEGHEIVSGQSGARARVPIIAGSYDYAGLTERLALIKRSVPVSENLILVAQADIPYDRVVATLDATRTAADASELFPNVTLAMAIDAQ
jgi:biopolymer transport protein TolR